MKRILVWDIPTRLFHWLLVGSFFGAYAIGTWVDDDSSLFTIHMFLGGIIAFMISLRVIWGFMGSRYARFNNFIFGPCAVFTYIKGTITGRGERHIGHNPGSSVAIFVMLILLIGLALTGIFMSKADFVEDLHELLAVSMIIVVGVHIAGVIWHTIRHRENITASMLHGLKDGEPTEAISSPRPLPALFFLALTALWGWGLYANYEAETSHLNIPFTEQSILIGEEHEEEH